MTRYRPTFCSFQMWRTCILQPGGEILPYLMILLVIFLLSICCFSPATNTRFLDDACPTRTPQRAVHPRVGGRRWSVIPFWLKSPRKANKVSVICYPHAAGELYGAMNLRLLCADYPFHFTPIRSSTVKGNGGQGSPAETNEAEG